MAKKHLQLVDCDAARAEMIYQELGKVRAWLSGFSAARQQPSGNLNLNSGPPGADAIRQIQIILKDSIAAARK